MNVDFAANTPLQTPQNQGQILVCRVGGMLTCIDLSDIERTISLVAIQAMPSSAPHVVGIMNFAGHSLPVIDLAIRLGLQSVAYTLDTPILVCVHERRRIGVIVQSIEGIQTLPDQQLTDEFGRYGAAFRASVHTNFGLVLMLNPAWLIQSDLYQDAISGEN